MDEAYRLHQQPFSAELLDVVTGFNCGSEEWENELAEWIQNEALDCSKSLGTSIWLYGSEADGFVGFGSLGETKLRYPQKRSKRIPHLHIPAVAIRKEMQHKPLDCPREERYAYQIMRHLEYEAARILQIRPELAPIISLFVHPDNKKAIRLYLNLGYSVTQHLRSNVGGVSYIGMVLNFKEHVRR